MGREPQGAGIGVSVQLLGFSFCYLGFCPVICSYSVIGGSCPAVRVLIPSFGFPSRYWGSCPTIGVLILLFGFLSHYLGSYPVIGVPILLFGFLSCYLGAYPVIWVPVLLLGFLFRYWGSYQTSPPSPPSTHSDVCRSRFSLQNRRKKGKNPDNHDEKGSDHPHVVLGSQKTREGTPGCPGGHKGWGGDPRLF